MDQIKQKREQNINADTEDVEIKLSGSAEIAIAPDLLIIPVPGHTKGHTVLLYQQLAAFKDFCWYSWQELIDSMEKLAHYDFEWVLPGYGRRYHGSLAEVKQEMQKCLTWMKKA